MWEVMWTCIDIITECKLRMPSAIFTMDGEDLVLEFLVSNPRQPFGQSVTLHRLYTSGKLVRI